MKNLAKKLCSIITVIAVILSAVSMLPAALAATAVTPLELDVPATANIYEEYGYAEFYFTPQQDGVYCFYSISEEDTYGTLYNAEENWLASDDNGGDGENFSINYTLSAGQTYVLRAQFSSGNAGSFTVAVTTSEVVSLTVQDVSIIENTNGYTETAYNEETNEWDIEWYCYEIPAAVEFTVCFKDGSSISKGQAGAPGISYNDEWYWLNTETNQSYENQWSAGNTYSVTAEILGVKTTFNVTITENPVESVVFEDASIIENVNGYTTTAYNEETGEYDLEWFCYFTPYPAFTVNFKDGSSASSDGSSIEYNGNTYSLTVYENQSYENQWTIGNTYKVTGEVLGVKSTFNVTVNENPIQSVVFDDITVTEYFDSNTWYEYNEETGSYIDWQHYDYSPSYTVYLKDGSTIESEYGNIVFEENDYFAYWEDNQAYENQWVAGGSYTVTAEIFGFEDTFTVMVEESPIVSVDIHDMEFYEGQNLGVRYEHDGIMADGREYPAYNYWPTFTVTLDDGSTIEGSGGIDYNGYWYSLSTSDDQSYTNQWGVGEHTATGEILGVSDTFTVTITEAPYESIEILSVNPIKETDYNYINENGDVIYYIPQFTYKIIFKDGTSLIRESNWYYEDHQISISENQNNEPWTIGGENLVTVSIGKTTATFSVIITEVTDWEYTVQDGKAYITNCGLAQAEITVPDEIDGYTVVGIMSMGDCLNSASVINLPDSVVFLSEEAFDGGYNLNTINVGANISELDPDAFVNCSAYEINVSENNPYFSTIDGIVYNKAGDTLVVYPLGQGYTYYVPDNVIDANVLLEKSYYSSITLEFGENSKAFKEVDGVTYSGDMTIVISCDPEKTGSYDMPDTVTTIKEFAFSGSQLSSVTISDNVSELVYNVFSYCNNLETISLPDTLKSIGDSAFAGSNLKNLTRLPNSLTEIGDRAFEDTSLKTMLIPSSVTDIGNSAFAYSTLETLTLSRGLESIGYGAFMYTNISALTIPDTVWNIGGSAFEGAYITSLTIPDNVTNMGSYAFAYNPLKTLTVGSGLPDIANGAFAGTSLTNVTLPKNIEYIGDFAFANSSISKVVFKADEVYIGDSAFEGCPLDKTTLTDNITGFGAFAFSGSSMTSVKIPDSVTDITYYSFAYSQDLANIDIPDNIEHIDGHAFDNTAWYNAQEDGVVYLENTLYHYKGDIPENTEIVVKNGTVAIADYAFEMEYDQFGDGSILRDVSGLKSVILPYGLKTIGTHAFYNCINLEKIVIPASVDTIEHPAFSGCESLTIYGYSGSYAESYANEYGIPFVAMVEMTTEEVKVAAPPEVIDQNANLIVEQTESDNIVPSLPEEMEFTNVKAFDIYFELEGETVQPNGTVTVELTVPDEFNGKYCDVYHIADDGAVTNMNAVYEDGKLVFDTTHFSVYAIIENVPAYTSGDINNDGSINNRDYALLMQYLNKWNVTIVEEAADVNRDGNINNRDYALLMQYLNKWDVELK